MRFGETPTFDRNRAKYIIDYLDRSSHLSDLQSPYLDYRSEYGDWHSVDAGKRFRLWFKYGKNGPSHVCFKEDTK